MPTNRTPIRRRGNGNHITPQVVELYIRAREIYDDDIAYKSRKDEFNDLAQQLALALDRPEWDVDIFDSVTEDIPPLWMTTEARLKRWHVDVNLGYGPTFEPARALRSAGVAILLVTGYDAAIIPVDLKDAPCLQKPVEPRRLVSAVASAFEQNIPVSKAAGARTARL